MEPYLGQGPPNNREYLRLVPVWVERHPSRSLLGRPLQECRLGSNSAGPSRDVGSVSGLLPRASYPHFANTSLKSATSEHRGFKQNLLRHLKFVCKDAFHGKATLAGAETVFGQVFGAGTKTDFENPKVPPPGGGLTEETQ